MNKFVLLKSLVSDSFADDHMSWHPGFTEIAVRLTCALTLQCLSSALPVRSVNCEVTISSTESCPSLPCSFGGSLDWLCYIVRGQS